MTTSGDFGNILRREIETSIAYSDRQREAELEEQQRQSERDSDDQVWAVETEARQRQMQPAIGELVVAELRDFAFAMRERGIKPSSDMMLGEVKGHFTKRTLGQAIRGVTFEPEWETEWPQRVGVWLMRDEDMSTLILSGLTSNCAHSGLLLDTNGNPWKYASLNKIGINIRAKSPFADREPVYIPENDTMGYSYYDFSGAATIDNIVPVHSIALDVVEPVAQPIVQAYRNRMIEIAQGVDRPVL